MTIGVILVNENSIYVHENGSLPNGRPSWDKAYLQAICHNMNVLCSPNTLNSLPMSITNNCNITMDTTQQHSINLGISTFKEAPPEVLLVTRTPNTRTDGKKFRFDNYTKKGEVEVWIKNN